MKRLAIGLFVVVVLGALLLGTFWLWASSESTACFGKFETRPVAEAAADAAQDEGFVTFVNRAGREYAVEFDHGATGADAREARRTFRRIVRRHGGRRTHPGNGCVERKEIGG